MRILLIGGTGTISSAITRQLAAAGHDLWLLNRGNRKDEVPESVKQVICDINDEAEVLRQIGDATFDAVGEFIGFLPSQVERDIRLFEGRTRQYVYISSASAYNKPAASHIITEGTTLANPHWQYSVHGPKGSWQVLKRMMEGKPVIVNGDGSSLWTLTWNEDFARGYIGLLGNPKAIGEAFQIMSDEQLTWNQIYECVGRALGVTPKLYHVASDFLVATSPKAYDLEGNLIGDKSVTVVFDCTKLKRAVPGFQATTRFDEGVRRCVAHILAHPELQTEDPEFDDWCDRVINALEQAKATLG